MADLNDALSQSTTISTDLVVEPYNAPTDVLKQARVFFPEEVYNLSPQTTLYRFLLALLGDSGVGGMKKALTYTRTQQALTNVHFDDLDTLFTGPFQFVRQQNEVYGSDPSNSLLTDAQWLEVHNKDASYRTRSMDYVKGLNLGPTEEGWKLIGRAATGENCEIYEQWKYYDDQFSDEPLGFPNMGQTTARSEVVVMPNLNDLSQSQLKYLNDAFGRVKSATVPISFMPLGSAAVEIPIKQVVSSSDFFYVRKFVTGNANLPYPGTSAANNTWIVPGVEVEAPTYAFSKTQENITYATIQSATASSYHVGPFNQTQQAIFGYLQNVVDPLTAFDPSESYVEGRENLEVSTPWSIRQDSLNLFVNQNYPIGYMALISNATKINKTFWASGENLPGVTDNIVFNFPGSAPVNMIEFEIGKKPTDISVEYFDGANWQPVNLKDDTENTVSVQYDNSTLSQWQPVVLTFDTVNTHSIQVSFNRRSDVFPFNNPVAFGWSIDLRNVRFALMVGQQSDFVSFPGVDVLGNGFTTELKVYDALNVLGNTGSFWQSQSNPSQFAVESLYFDISDAQGNAQTIDQIYLEPITLSNLMHVYYTDDDSTTSPAALDTGDPVLSDHFDEYTNETSIVNHGTWGNDILIGGVRYPALEKQSSAAANSSPSFKFYTTQGVAGLDADFDYGAIITGQEYGPGEITVQLANPGIYTNDLTQISTMIIGACAQGTANLPKFTLSYTTDGANAKFALNSYNGTAVYQTVNYSYVNGTLAQEDRLGIRNVGDNTAIGFIYPDPLSDSGAIPIGTVTAGPSLPLNYGQSYVFIHDTRTQMSMDLVEVKKITSTSVDDWDYKLWNPINQHYRLQKGYLNLPNPITAKYVKLEFSKLSASPYESIYNPNLPDVQFKAYPSWVVAYINDTFSQITGLNQIQAETVNYDLVNLGVQQPGPTLLGDPQPESLLAYVKSLAAADVTQTSQTQYNSWFNFAGVSDIQTPYNLTPQIYPNTLFQEDSLYHTAQNPNALNQVYGAINTNAADSYAQEVPLDPPPVGPVTARSDNSIVAEKNSPDLWFPRICRHGYQTVQAQRENKLAYGVAIANVGFYKKDRTVPNNDPFYFETLSDVSSADPGIPTTFVQSNWNFSVPFSSFALGPDQPTLGFEDFDGTPF